MEPRRLLPQKLGELCLHLVEGRTLARQRLGALTELLEPLGRLALGVRLGPLQLVRGHLLPFALLLQLAVTSLELSLAL